METTPRDQECSLMFSWTLIPKPLFAAMTLNCREPSTFFNNDGWVPVKCFSNADNPCTGPFARLRISLAHRSLTDPVTNVLVLLGLCSVSDALGSGELLRISRISLTRLL